jgi:hypothetical protein
MLLRADTGPATPVDRYSCQSLVEPTGAPPWLRVSRVARVGPRGARVQNNELAANWTPAMVETALMSAETKVATEKLPPGFKGAVATSVRNHERFRCGLEFANSHLQRFRKKCDKTVN